MNRVLVWSVVMLLATQVAIAAVPSKKVVVTGKYPGGLTVNVTCNVLSTGQATGSGTLSGTAFSYPFNVTKISTGQGTVILSGHFTSGVSYPITLTAHVPSGTQTFSYVVNGQTVSMTGQGTVVIQ